MLTLHGWFGSATAWGAVPGLVDGDRFTWAFLDARGYGSRRGETGDWSIAEVAADALAAADALGWEDFAVVGHSMGGSAAQRVLVDGGDRVTALVGISPVPHTDVAADVAGRTRPVLVVVGEHDPALGAPVMEQTFLQLYPNARLEVLANAGHYAMEETPVALMTLVERFLDESA